MSGELRRLFIAGVLLIPGGGALAQAFDPPARATADGSALYAPRFYPGQLYARQFYRADRHTPASRRSSKPAPLDLSVVNTVGTNTVSEGDGGAVARPPAGAAARTAQPAGGKSQPKQKHGIFTWAIFGFTEGSDTDVPGGKSLYNQSDGRFARANAGYWALATNFGVSYSPDARANLFVAGAAGDEVILNGLRGPLADDGSSTNVGVNGGIKYQMLDRPTSGFGLAFQAAPYYTRTGLATGNATHAVGSEFRLLADTELVPQTLFGAVNFSYTPEISTGSSGDTSMFEAAAAIAGRAFDGVFLGVETRYLDKYGGLFFAQHLGWALYAGPTLYVAIADAGYFGIAWSHQMVGRAAATPSASLELSDFERNQIRVKAGFFF
jgi:hypothetical protein